MLLGLVAGVQIAGAASPGPNFILISSYSTTRTIGHALKAAAGIVLGILIWSSLAILGFGVLISSSPAAYAVVQYFGAGYLIWLGVRMFVSSYRSSGLGSDSNLNLQGDRPAVKGFLVSIANPKTIAYYTSLFTVLVPPEAPVWVLGAVVLIDAIACGAWWVLVAYFFSSNTVKHFFHNSRRHIDRLFGGALILLGLKLAMDRH